MFYYYDVVRLTGYNQTFMARNIEDKDITHLETELEKDHYRHEYLCKTEGKNYRVTIHNNANNFIKLFCDCGEYKKTGTCKHIAGILLHHYKEIASYEFRDYAEIGSKILDSFNSKKISTAKEKVNVEYTISLSSLAIKLKIGTKKMYTINNNSKFDQLISAIKDNIPYEVGKQFTLDMDKCYFSKEDEKILNYLMDYKESDYGRTASPLQIDFRDLNYIFEMLNGTKFTLEEYGTVENIYSGMPTNFVLSEKDGMYNLDIEDAQNYRIFGKTTTYVYYKNNVYKLNTDETNYINRIIEDRIATLTFKKENLSKFNSGLFKKIKNNIKLDENIKDIELPTKPDAKLYFDINRDKLTCKVVFDYQGTEVNYFDKTDILRDEEEEDKVISELTSRGFYINNKDKIVLEGEDNVYTFLDEDMQKLTELFGVYTSKKIDSTNIVKKITTNNNFSIGQDGIMSYEFSVDEIDNAELENVFKALKSKKKYYKLKNNSVINLQNEELTELNNLVSELSLSGDDLSNGTANIPKYRALYIDSLKQNKYNNIKTNNLFDEFIENFKKYKDLDVEFDKFDNDTLRDYQKDGVKWLTTIYKCDFGAILADEMGLGKSVQAICFIKQILKEKPDAKIIIVAPTSLVYNWENEFKKFGSDLKYVVVAENKAKRHEILVHRDEYNIFITTYGLIRNDNDEYEFMNFELCIIDEAQMIKNYQANMTKEVKKIKSKCKIALTGTPVENNVTELWSIFDFIMPGYLNNIVRFKEKYNIKDVTDDDIEVLKNLNYLIKPFILRRKKQDVAKSLPEKLENNIYLELPKVQKMIYMKELEEAKEEIEEAVETSGFQKSRMKILQLLTKLRQICIDPSVLYENYTGESVKLEELVNIVKDNMGEHKILIFSSFRRVLNNVKVMFDKEGITYYSIDGEVKSKDRMRMVESFNNDDVNCFLITLKSGGTGLNLTGADMVIHLDIWWNPQVENQATDRAHRIGQEKKVTVIKLVTKGTIEERILELQEKKKILSDNLIEGKSGSESLSSLSEEDIKKLLSTFDE